MTTPLLLALIVSAWLLQLGAGIGFALWRRATAGAEPPADAPPAANPAPHGAWAGGRAFRVAERVFEDGARTQCSLLLEPVDAQPLPPYLPGQYLTLQLRIPGPRPGWPEDAAALTRCYSLSDKPGDRRYRITVKRIPAPAGRTDCPPGLASGWLVDGVEVGDVLQVRAPAGRFVIDAASDRPAVLIAGGIGITPLMSMLLWSLSAQPRREIHLYHGLRCGRERPFKAVLDALALAHASFHPHIVYSDADGDDRIGQDFHHAGRIDLELLRRTLPHGHFQFYLCGPSSMMADLVAALGTWGVPAPDIRYEAFGPASVPPATGGAPPPAARAAPPLAVRFRRSGRTLAWDGQDASLLDFAERHGVTLASGCRAGSCGSCAVKLTSGSVRYPHDPDFDVAPGECLPCIATPASTLVLEA